MRIILVIELIAIVVVNFLIIWAFSKPNLEMTPYYLMMVQIVQIYFLYQTLTQNHRNTLRLVRGMVNRESVSGLPQRKWWSSDNKLGNALNDLAGTISQIKIEREAERQLLLQLLEQIPISVILADSNDRIELANPAVLEMLNLSVLGNLKMIDNASPGLSKKIMQLRPGQPTLVKTRIGSNIMFLSVSRKPFKLLNRPMLLITLNDIKREIQQEEIESWQKLIHVLTHEMMNSLGPITSLSESLTEHFNDLDMEEGQTEDWAATAKIGLEAIRKRGEGLIDFVDSYRKIIRIPEPRIHPVDVSQMIDHTLVLMRKEIDESGVNTELRILNPLVIDADEKLISQLLINLIRNACQAMENSDIKQLIITTWITDGDSPRISISDSGCGISEDIRDKLFVPFFTTRTEGSGIGLNLSRQIMTLHGGSLDYRSIKGETIFTLSF